MGLNIAKVQITDNHYGTEGVSLFYIKYYGHAYSETYCVQLYNVAHNLSYCTSVNMQW